MSADTGTAKLDVAPLTVIVSEGLDPRVRRKMEAEQQADVKTYQEMTRDMEVQEDLNKIKQEVDEKGEESDPFKEPESVENQNAQADATNPTPAAEPAAQPDAGQHPAQQPAPADNSQQQQQAQPAAPADGAGQSPASAAGNDTNAGGGDDDLSSAFESHGMNLPPDLLRRVLKDYIKMESGDHDIGSLDHIKTFVYVDLGQNNVKGDTLESVQTLRDPENTIIVISEDGSPDADTTLRARKVAETLSNRGVKVFYDLDEAMDYLNELFDVVSGRKKGSE